MHVFYTPDIQKNYELPEEEAQHCTRVLRLGIGDEITLTDGKGHFYKAEITVATNKRCLVAIKETIFQEPLWPCHLHIAMAPTKNMDRNEWLAEKATEIGFDELTFLNCRFSERKVIKTERIEKILISAIKQSLKACTRVSRSEIYCSLLRRRKASAEKCTESRRRCSRSDRSRRRLQRRGSEESHRMRIHSHQLG